MILDPLRAAVRAAFPGFDEPRTVLMRVISQVASKLKLQVISTADNVSDTTTTAEVCPGVPGVTSDPTPGEQIVLAFVGKDAIPYVIARASEQMPGAVPIEVRHDAKSAIRFISKTASAGAKVYVGSTTFPVAMGPAVSNAFAALLVFATAAKASTTDPTLAAAALTLESALQAISGYQSTKLEAQ